MSMIAMFREITPALLGRIRKDPSMTEAVILGGFERGAPGSSDLDAVFGALPAQQREMLKAAVEQMPPEVRERMLAQISQQAETLRGLADAARDVHGGESVDPGELGETLDLQKAWHGLHYLLSGSIDVTPEPHAQAILGGIEIGDDTGYGPARFLDPGAVRNVAGALSSISPEALQARYDAAAMNEAQVYPGGWEDATNQEWLIESFEDLTAFYRNVAARGNALLLYLT